MSIYFVKEAPTDLLTIQYTLTLPYLDLTPLVFPFSMRKHAGDTGFPDLINPTLSVQDLRQGIYHAMSWFSRTKIWKRAGKQVSKQEKSDKAVCRNKRRHPVTAAEGAGWLPCMHK